MNALGTFAAAGRQVAFHDVRAVLGADVYARLPYVTRVLAENLLRHVGRPGVSLDVIRSLAEPYAAERAAALPLHVPRVIVPDSSGIPVLMDLAALRGVLAREGGDPARVNAAVPITLIVDHSLQVDQSAAPDAEATNLVREFERNSERYAFLKWAQGAFSGLEIFPPGSGIIHQIHLEQVARVTLLDDSGATPVAFPDFTVGGDSHTPMVNALGVLGWGVGGIEIETVALGESYILPRPEVVGVRLTGRQGRGITITDTVLAVTRALRDAGVVSAFVEFFGPGVSTLTVPDRATLANMAPEYGATTGFWPADEETLAYLRLTGRDPAHVALVEAHARAAGLFRTPDAPEPHYDRTVVLDLSSVHRAVSGPSLPHNRKDTGAVAESFRAHTRDAAPATVEPSLPEGAVVIAAITSCTNTANPHGMVRAALLAKAAVARGLVPPEWVKTSLAPGSRAVTTYLAKAGLLEPLEQLGFHVVGYGCTTCAGKSGPLKPAVAQAIEHSGRAVAAVLSGNRNFDGRIHRLVAANYLCSPALVVAYALAGRVTLDIDRDPLGTASDGTPILLADLWPDDEAVDAIVRQVVTPDVFRSTREGSPLMRARWAQLREIRSVLFPWDEASTYIVEPPFFASRAEPFGDTLRDARAFAVFADNLTTDHVSPGGEIPPESPAGTYLQAMGVAPAAFNTYVGRRGNHHVMARGTYANLRIKNQMAGGRAGWWTRIHPENRDVTMFEASEHYRQQGIPGIVIAGENFGAGSSRDWAAKGPALLGVRIILARSFERIHRSNLIGVGILPVLFTPGESAESLGLDGRHAMTFENLDAGLDGRTVIAVTASDGDATLRFIVRADVRSDAEADLLRRGGMFQAARASLQ